MKIGILGAGVVGSNFGKALVKVGHEVMFSSRTPKSERIRTLLNEVGSNAQAGTVAETLAFSKVIAVAISWDGLPDAVRTPGDWSAKILIDMTNRFGPAPADSAGSAAQDLAKMTGAQVVKAFNTIGAEHYLNPVFDGEAASMLIAGDSAEAKQTVRQLVEDLGFEPVDAGDLAAAAHLEALAGVWVHLAYRTGQGRDIAFRLIRR
jgi:predicted dinucleotide-binding enzyme